MIEFCAVDRRLLATGYVPLADFARARAMATEAIEAGAKALLVPSRCPPGHAPSHVELDPVWAIAQEAGLPVVFHVGGGGQLLSPDYFTNGLPAETDFHGGDENFRSVDYMAIPYPPMQTVATLIFDGVLDRFPRLIVGVIEQGASWVPSWMRFIDSAFDAFRRHEQRLQKLALRPSEYVRRQVRVDAVSHRRRRLDRRAGGTRDLPVLVRLPARRRRPQSRCDASRRRRRGSPSRPSSASTARTSRR